MAKKKDHARRGPSPKRPPKKARRPPSSELTPKQRRFVAEYLVDLNATQAAIRAGYSAKTAESQASRLLRNVKVAELVAAGKEQQLQKAEVTAERVLAEIARLCFSDVRKLFNEDGSLKPPTQWDDEAAAAVAGVDVVEMAGGAAIGKGGALQHVPMYTKKLKLWDKPGALGMLAKHLGLLKDRVELTGKDGGPVVTRTEPVDLTKLSDEDLAHLQRIVGLPKTA